MGCKNSMLFCIFATFIYNMLIKHYAFSEPLPPIKEKERERVYLIKRKAIAPPKRFYEGVFMAIKSRVRLLYKYRIYKKLFSYWL